MKTVEGNTCGFCAYARKDSSGQNLGKVACYRYPPTAAAVGMTQAGGVATANLRPILDAEEPACGEFLGVGVSVVGGRA